ncbi:MAG TPA: YdeI/OmpD-associated family protein [Candidatus Saccharimonadales bacterium]|nr:YdeI/OmpD-associated family protein [Candidatus Saccharimonadales bacterium]
MAVSYKNPGRISFDAVIQQNPGGGAYVEFPHDVWGLFGVKGRVPVNATFDGVAYRGSLAKMKADCHVIGVLKDIRAQIGKQAGDAVHVTIELDSTPRIIELPADVIEAWGDDVVAAFKALAYTHQREYAEWIDSAKQPETRKRRIAKAAGMIMSK